MQRPLVSVICLCYNQARFLKEAVDSVLNQTYAPIELIIVDDASTDNSVKVIQNIVTKRPDIQVLQLTENLGNCAAFNRGLALAKGEFIIDLAADDVLLPKRIETGVNELTQKGNLYGVHFSDAAIINALSKTLRLHSGKFAHNTIPQGDVYEQIIKRYFICPPTVMVKREVMDKLNGYDESLTYEDFDFWIRSSRAFRYCYSPEALVKRRISDNALSNKQFKFFNEHSQTTYRVCEKIMILNKNTAEQQALSKRILYEIRLNLRLLNWRIAANYIGLWFRNRKQTFA